MNRPAPVIALVAGEASGDRLGASLIENLREIYPGARFAGIGGRRMKEAGMEAWWDAEELAVFGLFEVLSHFPRLWRLRRELLGRLLDLGPDVFIGIDAPDFNLGLEIKLRRRGIRTVHYVSPTVWAWRQGRVRKIGQAAELVLCLFPFEPRFYESHGVRAHYVGHPLADQVSPSTDPGAARSRLGLEPAAVTIALLPGSRVGEVTRLAEPMIEAARLLSAEISGLQVVAAMANPRVRAVFEEAVEDQGFSGIRVVDQDAERVIAAADVVLCASGTATLETLLVNRPMVMAYRVSPATYHLAKHLKIIRPQFFALPNILADEALVPELIQHEAGSTRLASEARRWLDDEASRENLRERFSELHDRLRCNAGRNAAQAVSGLLEE